MRKGDAGVVVDDPGAGVILLGLDVPEGLVVDRGVEFAPGEVIVPAGCVEVVREVEVVVEPIPVETAPDPTVGNVVVVVVAEPGVVAPVPVVVVELAPPPAEAAAPPDAPYKPFVVTSALLIAFVGIS